MDMSLSSTICGEVVRYDLGEILCVFPIAYVVNNYLAVLVLEVFSQRNIFIRLDLSSRPRKQVY